MTYVPFPAFADWRVDFDPSVVDAYAERLRRAREASTPQARERALEIATRYAAVDTGAIEGLYDTDRGFTRTIATQSEFWLRALEMRGEQVKRSIQDALEAYEFVLDAVTQNRPITQAWIRELHATITRHQATVPVAIALGEQVHEENRPLPHGEYKRWPNNPTNRYTGRTFCYAAPEDTPAEMARLVDELRSTAFQETHPVIQAAYAHYAFVRIHPFTDGNGRVARALASVYLYRNPGVPLVVFADQRDRYLDALEAADAGVPVALVRFLAERAIDTIRMVELSLTSSPSPGTTAMNDEAREREQAQPHAVRLVGARLARLCVAALESEALSYDLPPHMGLQIALGRGSGVPGAIYQDFEPLAGENLITIVTRTLGGAFPSVRFWILLAARPGVFPELVVYSDSSVHLDAEDAGQDMPGEQTYPRLDVFARDLDPEVTATFQLALEAWAKTTVAWCVNDHSTTMRDGR